MPIIDNRLSLIVQNNFKHNIDKLYNMFDTH